MKLNWTVNFALKNNIYTNKFWMKKNTVHWFYLQETSITKANIKTSFINLKNIVLKLVGKLVDKNKADF